MSLLYPKLKYSMFVGYWQSWHVENSWLVEEKIKEGKNVLICVLDCEVNEKTPLTSDEVERNIKNHLWKHLGSGKLVVIKIPDIESINFGSNIEYDIIYHDKTDKSKMAEQIRKQLKEESL
jgi:hypothetical protein